MNTKVEDIKTISNYIMATTAPVGSSRPKPQAPAGTHVARIYKFMNMGKRVQEYMGAPKAYPDTLVSFTVELPNELHEFEVENKETGEKELVSKPFVVSREFVLSMGPKSNLRPFVEGVIGVSLTDEEAGSFDIETLVGKPCLATIVHKEGKNGNVYANLKSVSPLVKGMTCPDPINPSSFFDVKTASLEEINALPQFIQDKIKVSDEFQARFDPQEIERRQTIKENISQMVGSRKAEPVDAEDIPF